MGSDLREGRLTVDAAAAASFPSLLCVLSLFFHLSCLFLLLLTARHVGPWFPDKGSNPHSLH